MTERERFEAFFATTNVKGRRRLQTMFERNAQDDSYLDDSTQRHWWTWQNALRAMDEARAREVLDSFVSKNRDLDPDGPNPDDFAFEWQEDRVYIEHAFTADQLEAIAWWMRYKGASK